MNDITALTQREKFEAWWEITYHNGNPPRFGWVHWREGDRYKIDDDESELDGMWEVWKAASVELVEALEKAQQYTKERDEENESLMLTVGRLRTERESLENIRSAAEKLVRCKGRYHSEKNYRALAALFGVNTPDLPPLDGESRTVTVKLPTGYAVRPGHPINEGERGVMIPKDGGAWLSRFDVEHTLKVAGIQVIEGEGQ